VARHQADQVEYLKTVNRALLERLGKKRLRFTDAERKRLAVLGKKLGRKALAEVATIAPPDTILRWYRELVAKKYDSSTRRGPGRTSHGSRDRAAAHRDGDAEHRLGLHADARRAQECRVQRGSEHDQEDLEGAGHRTGATASSAVLVWGPTRFRDGSRVGTSRRRRWRCCFASFATYPEASTTSGATPRRCPYSARVGVAGSRPAPVPRQNSIHVRSLAFRWFAQCRWSC
jgi:hypothetical protein